MFKSLKKLSSRPQHQARRQNQLPTFETMEERRMMSGTYLVTTTSDSGTGSLRDAITQVDAGKDSVIDFNISKHDAGFNSATGLYNIDVKSQLPAITSLVLLDGYSQPGYAGSPLIEIDGSAITNVDSCDTGLWVCSRDVTVRGLSADNFTYGIELNPTYGLGNDVVAGNDIGLHPNSLCANGGVDTNGYCGIDLVGIDDIEADGTTIQGNTIQRMAADGIYLSATTNNTIQANTISACVRGVYFYGSSANVLGGYDNPADANYIQATCDVLVDEANNDAIVGNSLIGSNQIDLEDGSNQAQAAPIVTSAKSTTAGTTIAGTVHSVANCPLRVELFADGAYIGAETITADAKGNVAFTDTFASRLGGETITATATVMQPVFTFVGKFRELSYVGETSQFSSPILVVGPGNIPPIRLGL